ncbi:cilia- and flagella-associated protein 157 isoform X1 [Gopherus evgoodei]|uniref:cilia- and flagella-associated protein 157 isoform X1 n=1 Tax=Gopherus evgoodei TaxID=1825980 RepID=UPI0011CF6BFE|nr:cilia- and flagella-associated protein 157 isoform X1 [Gopherus evgoodei]
MAPRKKGGGGGGRKEDAAKEARPDGKAEQPLAEHSREFYLLQIRDLEKRLARYQRKWDEMRVNETLFRVEYDQMANDNKEIVAFLKKTLNQRVDEIADLNDQLLSLQQAKESEKDAFEAQLAQVRHEFQETKDQLTSENMLLSGKLAALEEFRIQKDDLLGKFAALEEQLKKQEEDHKEYIYNLERKAVLDKDRLKKEMMQRVNMVAAEFRKVSNSQMAETTKRTIRENVAINVQLAKMSDRSYDLIQENDMLKEAQAEMQKQLEMLEHNEKQMAKNSLGNQKMIWMLTNKCKEQQVLVDEYKQQKEAMQQLKEAHEMLQKENQALRQELKELKEEVRGKMVEGQSQAKLLEEEQKLRKNAERILNQAVQALKDLLQERPSDEENGDFDMMFQLRHQEMLRSLLGLLRQAITAGPPPREQVFGPQKMANREHGLESTAESQLHSALSLKSSPIISHHLLVQRGQGAQLFHNMSKTGLLSKTTRIGTVRTYTGATEPPMTSWSEEKRVKQQPILPLPEIVARCSLQGLLNK